MVASAEEASAFRAIVEKRPEPQPELLGQIVVTERLEQRDGRSERADKCRALIARAQMLFEVLTSGGRQPAVEIFREKTDEFGAVGHPGKL
jgi:hypothetical protein